MTWTVKTEGPQAITDESLKEAFAAACPEPTPFAVAVFGLLSRLPASVLALRDQTSGQCAPLPKEATVTIGGTDDPEGPLEITLTITARQAPPDPHEH